MREILRLLVHAAPLALLALSGAGGGARAGTDWFQYIASHPDLIRALGADEAAGERHYLRFGQAEGRALDGFDEERYLASYPDLQAAFGGDTRAATLHYIEHGHREGRTDAPAAPPRNVVLIVADDFGIDAAGFYPTSVRRVTTPPAPPMPNLRALTREGVLFTRAWANPWCSPTRAAILTGRYGFRTGIGRAWSSERPPLPLSEFTLSEAFKAGSDADYVLANLGKWHLSGGNTDPNRQGWTRFAGLRPGAGAVSNYFSWPKTVNGATATSRTYATTDQVNEALAEIARAEAQDRPYFLWVAFAAPHSPFHKPPNALHSKDSLPATGASNRAYFEAMVEAMDTEIGRLLNEVDLATTTVIFVGDNGTTGAVVRPPYPSSKDKGTMYQGGVHVPLLVAGAGVEEPGRLVTGLVDTTDLFPTILQLAGIDPAAVVPAGTRTDGVSLLPYIENRTHPEPRAWAYAEQFPTRYNARWQRAIRDARYKLIERWDGGREFYDLGTDAFETRNLLRQTLTSTQSQRLRELDQRLDALLATR